MARSDPSNKDTAGPPYCQESQPSLPMTIAHGLMLALHRLVTDQQPLDPN